MTVVAEVRAGGGASTGEDRRAGAMAPGAAGPGAGPVVGPVLLSEDAAERLAGVIAGRAAVQARSDHALLLAVAEFDEGQGARWFADVRDTAHWLSWACGMAPLTAREHVRVARALRQMPQTSRLMGEGRLSYSKVREMTRAVGLLDEAELCRLAVQMSAAQVARVVRTFRLAPGTRVQQEQRRRFSWSEDGEGMVRMSVVLPADEAAVVRGALDRAVAVQLAGVGAGERVAPDHVTAVVDVARGYREGAAPADEALVVVHVDAAVWESADAGTDRGHADWEAVDSGPADSRPGDFGTADSGVADSGVADSGGVGSGVVGSGPDDTDADTDAAGPVGGAARVPAGTGGGWATGATADAVSTADAISTADPVSTAGDACAAAASPAGAARPGVPAGVAYAEAGGRLEGATVSRLACTGSVVGARVDSTGSVVSFGRRRRLVSRAQRRALRIRALGMCEYPGCSTTYGLDAHHVVAWALGGVTDLTNLVLLCRRHHVCVHEGGVSIVADRATAGGWRFRRPNGEPVLAPGEAGWFAVDAELELARLAWAAQARAEAAEIDARLAAVAADFDRRWDEGVTGALVESGALVQSGVVGPIVEPGAGEGFHLTECVDALLVGSEREDRRG